MRYYYASRKSIPLGIAIWGLALIGFYLSFPFKQPFSNSLMIMIPTIIWIAIFIFIGFVWFGIGYSIIDDILIIKMGGLVLYEIHIKDIISLERSYSAISSPANSIKRIRIKYIGGEVLISPEKEKDFLALLKSIKPDLRITI